MNIQRRLFLAILVTIAWPFMTRANDDVDIDLTPESHEEHASNARFTNQI